MRPKMGLLKPSPNDQQIITKWLTLLEAENLDFTNSFRTLSKFIEKDCDPELPHSIKDFIIDWKKNISSQNINLQEIKDVMDRSNPSYIPRNHLVEKAISEGLNENFDFFNKFHQTLLKPFEQQKNCDIFQTPAKEHEKVEKTFCGT